MSPRRDLRPSGRLILHTLRDHRVGLLSWVIGGAAAMLFLGLAIAKEMQDFPGGPKALAASVMPMVEAMRPLRWPAERLDTIGGYLTFHNVILFSAFLAIYSAVQGARAIRAWEERGSAEMVLATGWSRFAFIRDRCIGFAAVLACITIGMTAGVAWAMAASDAPDLAGSAITMLAVGMASLVAYMLALLISQLTRSSRAGGGIAVLIIIVLYLVTNVWEQIGPFGLLRFLSPFYFANRSRALVPGYGFDVAAMLALLLMAMSLFTLAALAYARRDYAAALWARRPRPPRATNDVPAQRWWLHSMWSSQLVHRRWSLLTWTISAAAFAELLVALQPQVMDAWGKLDFMAAVLGGTAASPAVLYTSFIVDAVAPVVVGYVITQAAGWLADLQQGRVEAVLSLPVSWTRLVLERVGSTVAAVLVLASTCMLAIAVGSRTSNFEVDGGGLLRALLLLLLLGVATTAVSATIVATLRNAVALAVLATYAAVAYFASWLIGIYHWPQWILRVSVFDAFSHPYQQWPTTVRLSVLLILAVPGTVLACGLAERSPRIA